MGSSLGILYDNKMGIVSLKLININSIANYSGMFLIHYSQMAAHKGCWVRVV